MLLLLRLENVEIVMFKDSKFDILLKVCPSLKKDPPPM